MNRRASNSIFGVLMLVAAVGCSDPLYEGPAFDPSPTDWELVSRDDASRYEWRIQNGKFVVTKPPPMAYLTSFDKKFDLDDRFDAPLVHWDDLQLSDEAESAMNEVFREPPNERMESILALGQDQLAGKNAFDISSDGKRLVLLNAASDALVLHDASDGRRVGEMPLPADWSAGVPTAVRFCGETKDFMVASPSQIVRISGKNGQVVASAGSCQAEISVFEVSRTDDAVLAVTVEGKLFLGRSDLGFFEAADVDSDRFDDATFKHGGGGMIAATKSLTLKSYELEDARIISEKDVSLPTWKAGNPMRVISGITSDAWLDKIDLLARIGEDLESKLMHWRPYLGTSCSMDEQSSWLLLAGDRLVENKRQWIVFSYGPKNTNHSAPVVIDELPLRMIANQGGTVVIRYDTRGLHVGRREAYRSLDQMFYRQFCYDLINRQPTSQIEKLYEAIGRQPRLVSGIPASAWQSSLLKAVGYRWNYLDENSETLSKKDKTLLAQLQAWREKDGTLARTASAFRHQRLGWDARGSGYANSISRSQWDVFEKETSLAMEEIEPVFDGEIIPALAFSMYLSYQCRKGQDLSQLDSVMKRAVEMYPANSEIPDSVAFMLLPQWGGTTGDVYGLITAHANLISGDYADILYASMVGSICRYNLQTGNSSNGSEWRTISTNRIDRAIRARRKYRLPATSEVFYLTVVQDRLGNSDNADEIANYLFEATTKAPANNFRTNLMPVLKRKFEQIDPPKSAN